MTSKAKGMKRTRKRRLTQAELEAAARFKQAGSGSCVVCNARGTEAHHAIEAQWLRRNLPEHVYDSRLAVPLCRRCHARHTSAFKRLPYELLPESAHEFAREHDLEWYVDRYYPATERETDAALPPRANRGEEMSRRLATTREVAAWFGVHENTVRNWANDGLLPVVNLPGSGVRRFPRAEVERMRDEMLGQFAPDTELPTEENG